MKSKKIFISVVFSLISIFFVSPPAFAANEIHILISDPDSDGITTIGFCFTNISEMSGGVSYGGDLGSGGFSIHSGTPSCPTTAAMSIGQRLTAGNSYTYSIIATNGGRTYTDTVSFTAKGISAAAQAAIDLRNANDAAFRTAIDAATAAAAVESRAWNAANPGKQKCIQWGPIVHANGVSTSSGGVCANIVEPGAGTTVATEAAPTVTGPTTSSSSSTGSSSASPSPTPTPVPTGSTVNASVPGSGAPFTMVLAGQLSTSECPVGFQGANGIIMAIGTGTFTECWPVNAWAAYRLGGTYWEKYKSSGGTYDIQAELTRQAGVANYKAQAKAIAQTAANSTPGIQRCSAWSAYGESGQECAYTFVAPSGVTAAPVAPDSITTTSSTSDSSSATSASNGPGSTTTSKSTSATTSSETASVVTNGNSTANIETKTATAKASAAPVVELQTVSLSGSSELMKKAASAITTIASEAKAINNLIASLDKKAKAVTSRTNSVALPVSVVVDSKAVSKTPSVCSISSGKITKITSAICKISFVIEDEAGNSYSIDKEFDFRK